MDYCKEKYFKTKGARKWVFATTEKQEDGPTRELILLQESDTPIQRHVKIKADANPHDPKWAQYFESRWGKQAHCNRIIDNDVTTTVSRRDDPLNH